MRIVLAFLLALVFTGTIGQRRTAPTNLPSPNSAAYSKVGWYRSDSAVLLGIRNDTNWTPITPALIPYKVGGADTSLLTFWDGKKWVIMAEQAAAGNGYVTSLGYRPGDFVDTFYYTNANGATDWYYSPIVSGLLSGGDISRIGISLNYAVTLAVYRIGRTLYISPADTVTIAARDSLPRIDVFYADTNSLVGVLTGVPDSFPLKPSIDVASQVELGFVYVPAIGDTTSDLNVPNFVLFGMGNKINGEFQFAYDSTTNTVLITGDQDRFELNGDQWYHANSSGDLRTAFLKRGGSGLTTAGNIWRWGEFTIRPSLRGGNYGTVVFGNDEVFESGIGFPALKHVAVYTDEVERLTVDSVGRVYIKTTPRDTMGFKLLTIDPNSGEIMQTDPVSNVDTCNAITNIGTIIKASTTPYVCYNVPDVFFAINCTQYFAAADSVCIQPPSPDSLGRFDVIYADTLGNIGVIQGTVDSFPVIPNVNPAYQIFITAIYVQIGNDTAQTLQVPNNVLYGKNNLGTIFGEPPFNYADSLDQVGIRAYPYTSSWINNNNGTIALKVGDDMGVRGKIQISSLGLPVTREAGISFETAGWQKRQILDDYNAKTVSIIGGNLPKPWEAPTGTMNLGNDLNFVGIYDSMQKRPLVFTRNLNQFVFSVNSDRRAILIPRVSAARLANMKQYGNAVQDNITGTLQEGMIAFDATNKNLVFSRDTGWVNVTGSGGGGGACDTCITNISYRSGDNVDTLYYTNNNGDTDWYYVITRDGLISGGIVTYSGFDRTYYVSAAVYRKGGVFYTTNDTTIVLPALADPDSSRVDVFVVNTSSQTTTIQGVESGNPLTPQINPETDVYLTHVTLTPSNPSSGVDTTVIYDENVEWTGAATGVTVNFANTSNVYRGTYATDIGAINNNDIITYTNGSLVNRTQYAGVSMFLRLKQSMPNNNNIFVSFYNGATQVTSEVALPLVKSLVGSYQGVSIAFSDFNFTNSFFDRIRFRYAGSGAGITGLYLDFVYLQNGISPVVINPGSNFVQNIQRVGNDVQQQINNVWSTQFSIEDKVDTLTAVFAGDGLVGGGTLSASRTLRVDTSQVANKVWVTDRLAGYEPTITAANLTNRYWNGYKQFVQLNTDSIIEGSTNKFYTDARARGAISLTTTGTSGAATYDNVTGVLNIPQYSSGSGTVTSFSSGSLSPLFTTSVATATTTPALSFSLSNAGAYTVFGNQTNASAAPSFAKLNINSIDATGTPSATTYLRGDGSWATVSGGGTPIDSVTIRWNSAGSNIYTFNGIPGSSTFQERAIYIGESTGSYNRSKFSIGIGYQSLSAITSRDSGAHVAIGYQALAQYRGNPWITTPSSVVAIGYQAATADTTNGSFVAIGSRSLSAARAINQTVAVGNDVLLNYNPTVNAQTTAIGERAGQTAVSGAALTLIGSAADVINAGISNAVAVGASARVSSNGTSVGYGTANASIGTSTVTIGQQVAINSSSSQSVFIGAGYDGFSTFGTAFNMDGNQQTVVGCNAGNAVSATTGARNNYFGALAGSNGNGAAADNIAIGANSQLLTGTGSSQLTIGSGSSVNRWIISDVSGSHRRWTISGSTTDVSANTAGVTLDITGTAGGVRFPSVTIAQRNTITAATNNQVTSSELDIDNDYNGTTWTVNDGVIFTQTADKNINTTASETTLFGTGSGTLTIPANYLYSGNTITIKIWGYMTTNGTPTLDIKFKLGSTTICSTGATTLVSVASNGMFVAECILTARASPGAAAAIMGQGRFDYYSSATTLNSISAMNTTTVNAATNGSLAVDVTATFGTSDAANKIVATNAEVTIKN